MVTRNSSIPQPDNPPPPPPTGLAAPSLKHILDSSNARQTSELERHAEEDSPYKDMGNPWLDTNSSVQPAAAEHPDVLRPGLSKPATNAVFPDTVDILKPGWSGQNTPRSSLDSDRSKDFWESSEDEEEKTAKGNASTKGKQLADQNRVQSPSTEDLVIPSPLQIKRKPVGTTPSKEPISQFEPTSPKIDFASNNPFRQNLSLSQDTPASLLPSWGSDVKGKGKEPDSVPTEEFGNLSMYPGNESQQNSSSFRPSKSHEDIARPQYNNGQPPPPPTAPPPPVPVTHVTSPFSEQPPLIPVSSKDGDFANPWASQQNLSATPSPTPFAPSQRHTTHSTDDLLDRGQKADGRISLGDELRALPNAAHDSNSNVSLLDNVLRPPQPPRPQHGPTKDEYAPPPGPPPSHLAANRGDNRSPVPPVKPPRPAIVVKPFPDNEIAQMQEQRNETYQIKHFNWFDHRSSKLRTSSMLTQNANGPCPLLALVNALILGAKYESQAALDEALRSREQVTLGLIIETLMDQLLSSGAHIDGDLPDVDELNQFLLRLRTGMNMNPRFIQPRSAAPNLMDTRNSILHMPAQQAQDQPGDFEPTKDVRLYNAFGIRTMHGWLPEPHSDAVRAFGRSAQNYEDAQVVQFGEEELEYKLSHGGLTPKEQSLWEDIISIKDFFRFHPTQLTPYGLQCINQFMQPGSFAILFRNDHFSTIYKHPRDGKLYSLVTDAGYAERDEIIWESLVDVSGQQSEFFSGDFQSVSHHVADNSRRRSSHLSSGSPAAEPLSPQQQQEQHDADFAMALHLQEEEEERMRQERNDRNSRTSSGSGPAGRGNGANTRRGSGIPIPLRNNNSGSETRPVIPPRNQRSGVQAVSRPSDALDADAPPTYEEAARGKPYNPPLGSPLHPESSASAEPSPYHSTSHVDLPEAVAGSSSNVPPPQPRRPERRQSAYYENLDRYGHATSPRSSSGRFEMGVSPAYSDRNNRMPGTYVHTGRGGHGQGSSSAGIPTTPGGRPKREDGDCVVM